MDPAWQTQGECATESSTCLNPGVHGLDTDEDSLTRPAELHAYAIMHACGILIPV